MTPTTQTTCVLRGSGFQPLDQAKQLASALLSERGEASGAFMARELHEVLRGFDAADRLGFQRYLAATFQPDGNTLRAAAERYLTDATAEAAAAVLRHAREVLQLRRIVAITVAENRNSIAVLEKIGLQFERMISLDEYSPELKLFGLAST